MAMNMTFDLSKAISKLEMPSTFDRRSANFERIAEGAGFFTSRLHVSQFLHQAVFSVSTTIASVEKAPLHKELQVSEGGTDESVRPDDLSLLYRLRTEKSFVADHPFVFAVLMTNYLLFLGRFTG